MTEQKTKDTRVDHTQYDPLPMVAEPLATAATNKQAPTTDGPPWWCGTCDSWRFVQPCGRDGCPTPGA